MANGYITGKFKVVDHGLDSLRYNIVILGDGYQASEMAKYQADVQTFIDTFRATAPYNELWCGINFYRVDVVSTDSGVVDPATCGDGSTGSGAAPSTYFSSSFCNSGIRRLLECDTTSALSVAQAQVPQVHMTMVIVNTNEYGGSGGPLAVFSTNASSAEIGLHEMGHTAFGFADEYPTYAGCSSGETGHDHHVGGEPSQPNVTIDTDVATIKWNATLTAPADGLPTTANADCSQCDPQGDPKSTTYVGAYEGADYVHCGCYRPSFDCRMNHLGIPFCGVCQQVIRDTLQPFLPTESLSLSTPSISFANIPEGLGGVGVTTYRAIVFEVVTCSQRTFQITAGPTGGFGTPFGASVQVTDVDADPVADARLWISYTSTQGVSSTSGSVTVHCNETGQQFVIPITANTVPRPKSAVAMVFDHSGSMADDAGDGETKVAKLRESAGIFINAMLPGDGVSITRFDGTSQILMPVTDVGPVTTGAGRAAALGHINGPEMNPAGITSIGAGVVNGKKTLDDAQMLGTPHYDVTAMIVLTDGEENYPPKLSAVSSSITANTFAIGLGLPENISVAALNTLTQGHNGYLLVTGTLTTDQSTRLTKYFLQILAGITNANVILDPHGELGLGEVQKISFFVSDTDMGIDVFLLAPVPSIVDFELETPDGTLLNPASVGNIKYVQEGPVAYYRIALPALPGDPNGTCEGRWNAVLRIKRGDKEQIHRAVATSKGNLVLPYDVIVHCYSNPVFKAADYQSSFEPGAIVNVYATLTEYDVPVEKRAGVWAEVNRPDGSIFKLSMAETDPGRYANTFLTSLSGLYSIRVRAVGTTFRGDPFQREQTLSAAVYPGGNKPPNIGGGDCGTLWCGILECLLSERVLGQKVLQQLKDRGINLKQLALCIAEQCRLANGAPTEGTAKNASAFVPATLNEATVRLIVRAVLAEMGC
jgi:hypothetical protein